MPKNAQTPQRQVHAVLAGVAQDSLIENQNQHYKTDKIIVRTLFFSKNKNCELAKTLTEKLCQRTRTIILKSLNLLKP